MPIFQGNVKYHWDMQLRTLIQNRQRLKINDLLIPIFFYNINKFRKILPPTVQNCPNRFSDATFKPLLRIVTWVSLS